MLGPRRQSGECRSPLRNIMDKISLNECHVFTRHERKNECTDFHRSSDYFSTSSYYFSPQLKTKTALSNKITTN